MTTGAEEQLRVLGIGVPEIALRIGVSPDEVRRVLRSEVTDRWRRYGVAAAAGVAQEKLWPDSGDTAGSLALRMHSQDEDDAPRAALVEDFGTRAVLLAEPLLEVERNALEADFLWLCWHTEGRGHGAVGNFPSMQVVQRICERASNVNTRELTFSSEGDWDLDSVLALRSAGIPNTLLVLGQRDQRRWGREIRDRLNEIDRILTDVLGGGESAGTAGSPFRELFSRSGDMIAVVAKDGTFVTVSDASRELLGFASEELVGESAYRFFHSEDTPQLRHVHSQLVSSDSGRRVTHRMQRKDGSWIWVETQARRLRPHQPDNSPILTITRSIQSEVVSGPRRTAENWFWSVFEGSVTAMALIDMDGTFLQVNEAFCELLGYAPSELLATDITLVSTEADASVTRERFRALVHGNVRSVRFAKEYVRKDAREVPVLCTLTAIPDAEGRPAQFLCLVETEEPHRDLIGDGETPLETLETDIGRPAPIGLASVHPVNTSTTRADDPDFRSRILQEILESDDVRPVLDHLSQITARALGTPVAQVNLVFSDRQCSLSSTGPGAWDGRQEVPLEASICRHAVESGQNLLISDAETDPLTKNADAILATDLRAYAAIPVQVSGSMQVGTLCVVDFVPREWNDEEIAILEDLARFVGRELDERVFAEQESHRLSALVDSSPIPTFSVDGGGSVTTWSRAAERFFGIPKGAAVGTSVLDILPKEVAGAFYPAGDVEQPIVGVQEVWIGKQSDEEKSCLLVMLSPLEDLVGRTVGNVLTLRDITTRKESEQSLQLARERLNQVLDTASDAIITLDEHHRILLFNDAAEKVFGYDEGEVLGEAIDVLLPDSVRAEHHRHIDGFTESPVVMRRMGERLDVEGRRKNGELFPAAVGISKASVGGELYFTAILKDVTEDREREAREREATARLRYVLSVSPAVTYVLSYRGGEFVPTWVTDDVESVLGFGKEDVLDASWWRRHVHPSDLQQAQWASEQLLDKGRFSREYRIRKADGDYIWVSETSKIIEDAEGRPVEVIGSWMDVTERVRVDEATEVAARTAALGRMTGAIAHDVNNTFAAIQAATELILAETTDTSIEEYSQELLQSVDRGARFVRQLLTVSRDAPQERRPVDLAKSIIDMDRVAGTVLGKNIKLHLDLDDDLPPVMADPSQIEQVLLNLLVNARDALEGDGNVWIEVISVTLGEGDVHGILEPGEHVRLTIRDDGPGIPDGVREHIFEPFFTTKSPEKGTGLGLSTVYGIVRQHEGRVRVHSAKGGGAEFEILLPVSDVEMEPDTTSTAGADTVTVEEGGWVLLVEDEDGVRRGLRRLLERHGFDVLEASNGQEALEILAESPETPRLIITDLMMPGMKGTELIHEARKRMPEIPTLLMTGFAEEEILNEKTADMELIEKPFDFEMLLRRLGKILDR